MRAFFVFLAILLNAFYSTCFLLETNPYFRQSKHSMGAMNRNEKALYRNYLVGLRKTRRYVNHTSIETIRQVLEYTNDFTRNNSLSFGTYVNNTDIHIKSIAIGSVVLDVSNIKHIYISTKNESITIELDKKPDDIKKGLSTIFGRLYNIDTMISTISFISKIIS